MKKSYTFISLFFFTFLVISCQNQPNGDMTEGKLCCSIENKATASFASFASDPAFLNKHEAPESIDFKPALGEDITFKATDGQDAKAFLVKSKKKTNKYLFVIHEWWGLNDYIKKEAEKFAKDLGAVHVLALDLYDGKLATTPEDAGKYMQATKAERAEAIIKGAIAYAGDQARIATVGWCFGGGWSLQSSLIAKDQAVACIIYYGMPEKDKEKLKNLKPDVLGIFATEDAWINNQVVSDFEAAMKEVGKNVEIKSYKADHAFANPSNPKYNKAFAEDAYTYSIKFLKKRL
ncbi:MAG: dienelactone hydrolase family protein [Microscillaceae bacterium]|nr:dienelactone hydrolase family protein [Microscillaceae bacterium]